MGASRELVQKKLCHRLPDEILLLHHFEINSCFQISTKMDRLQNFPKKPSNKIVTATKT